MSGRTPFRTPEPAASGSDAETTACLDLTAMCQTPKFRNACLPLFAPSWVQTCPCVGDANLGFLFHTFL